MKETKTLGSQVWAREGEVKRRIFALLTTSFILLISSFTLNSCKSCDRNNTDDPITSGVKSVDGDESADGDKSQDGSIIDVIGGGVIDGNESNSESAPAFDALDGFALSEVAQHLRQRGASNAEIKAMVYIGRGGFGEGIGHIVHSGGHFNYRDTNGTPYEGQTQLNCGLYAMKRLLFVLGRRDIDIVDKNLWYEHTDQELRDELAAMPKGEIYKEQDRMIDAGYLMRLMMDIGVPVEYRKIYDCNGEEIKYITAYGAPALTVDELATLTAKIHKEIPELSKQKEQIMARLTVDKEKVETWMETVKNDTESWHVRNNATQEVIKIAEDVERLWEELKALDEKFIKDFSVKLDVNSAIGDWDVPPDLLNFVMKTGSEITVTKNKAEILVDNVAVAVAEARKRVL